MHSCAAAVVLGLAACTVVSAAPMKNGHKASSKQFPLSDGLGFPNPSPDQLSKIEDAGFGILPNGAAPPQLNDDTFISIRLLAFSETVEAVFFDQLIQNITDGTFTDLPSDVDRTYLMNTLKSMRATEELHALNAQNALKHFGKDQIQTCEYVFPGVDSFGSAIDFIAETTDFVQGVLGDVINKAASADDAGFTRGVAGALSNEGEQDGFFHFLRNLRPNQKPFNTIATREYAFSKLQDLIVPGSCPNIDEIKLPVYQPLNANNPPAKTVDLDFTFSLKQVRALPSKANDPQNFASFDLSNFASVYGKNWSPLAITYLNGQQKPASSPIKSLSIDPATEVVTVVAEFPFDEFKMFGLSVAALTLGNNFPTQDEMVKATLFGPALLETQEAPF